MVERRQITSTDMDIEEILMDVELVESGNEDILEILNDLYNTIGY